MEKKTIGFLMIIMCLLMITGCNSKKEIKQELKPKYDTEEFYFDNLSKDGYGFIVYNGDLVQLNKNGESKTIIDLKNDNEEAYSHNLILINNFSNNKLYFAIIKDENVRFFYIDIDKLEIKQLLDVDITQRINSALISDGIFNDKYLFYVSNCDNKKRICETLYRYNLESFEEEKININVPTPENIYIYDSRLYYKSYIGYYDDENVFDYGTMNFDGTDIKTITKEEYYDIKNSNNIIIRDIYADMYYMYNNKKVYILNNKLYYGDEVIYEAKYNKISIAYMKEYGKIGIRDFTVENYQEKYLKYYVIDLETKNVTEVSNDENMYFLLGYGDLLYNE